MVDCEGKEYKSDHKSITEELFGWEVIYGEIWCKGRTLVGYSMVDKEIYADSIKRTAAYNHLYSQLKKKCEEEQ